VSACGGRSIFMRLRPRQGGIGGFGLDGEGLIFARVWSSMIVDDDSSTVAGYTRIARSWVDDWVLCAGDFCRCGFILCSLCGVGLFSAKTYLTHPQF